MERPVVINTDKSSESHLAVTVLHTRSAFGAQAIDALKKACPSATMVEYAAKTPLFPQGVLIDSVFLMITGLVKLTYVDSGGEEITVGVRQSGWLLGATAAILSQLQPAGAVTLTSCRLLRTSAADICSSLKTESQFSRYLHELQAQEAHDHLLREVDLASRSAEYRLAKLLSDLASGMDSHQQAVRRNVQIPFKQWEIAELLSLTPEHTCRILRRLEQEGLILHRNRQLFVPEPERLLSLLND